MRFRLLSIVTSGAASLVFFLVVVLGMLAYLHFSQALQIRKITCHVNEGDCPDYLQAELEKNLYQSLLFTRYDHIVETIEKYQPSLRSKSINKNLNGEVKFLFDQTKLLYAIKYFQSPYMLVDGNGLVSEVASQSALPQIIILDEQLIRFQQGEQLPPELHQQLKMFVVTLQQLSIPYQQVSLLENNQIEILLPDDRKAVVSLEKAQEELLKLQFLLNNWDQLQIKEPFRLIDLRFKYPVLKP